MIIRNQSPVGALDVPLLGVIVDAGTEVEVTDDQAERLLPQGDVWAPADHQAEAIATRVTAADPAVDNNDAEGATDDATE